MRWREFIRVTRVIRLEGREKEEEEREGRTLKMNIDTHIICEERSEKMSLYASKDKGDKAIYEQG